MTERYILPEPSDDQLAEAGTFLQDQFPNVYTKGTLEEIYPRPAGYVYNHETLSPYHSNEPYTSTNIESWQKSFDDALRLHSKLTDQDC